MPCISMVLSGHSMHCDVGHRSDVIQGYLSLWSRNWPNASISSHITLHCNEEQERHKTTLPWCLAWTKRSSLLEIKYCLVNTALDCINRLYGNIYIFLNNLWHLYLDDHHCNPYTKRLSLVYLYIWKCLAFSEFFSH